MDTKSQEIYSEIYSVLNMLGENYIRKTPPSLYKMIKDSKSITYNPKYVNNISLDKQQIKRESLSMIALFHLNYWCESNEEKEYLKKIFNDNEKKYQTELRKKYNPDNVFKNRSRTKIAQEKNNEDIVTIIEYKENILSKIINKIKKFFKR